MLFNSLEFVIFIIIVIPLHAILRGRLWKLGMVIVSYVFYGWANPWFCFLLFLSTVVDFKIGQRISRTTHITHKKYYLASSIVVNLGILAIFKYSLFFVESLNSIALSFNLDLGMTVPYVVLPVGISFYTFQTLSYSIDVYRGKMEATEDFLSFALFVALLLVCFLIFCYV